MTAYQIVPIAEHHIPSFRSAVDVIARERKYLAFLEAPPLEDVTGFVLGNMERGYPQFVVLSGDAVVGWCDVIPNRTRVIYSQVALWESACCRIFAAEASAAG